MAFSPSEVPPQAEMFQGDHPYAEALWKYIDTLQEDELEAQSDMAATLLEHGPMQRVSVIIPVHTDDIGLVDHALSQYARQRYPDTAEDDKLPFTVYLGINGKLTKDEAAPLLEQVQHTADTYPQLDVRLTYQQYDPKRIRIGKIRRDMWNAVALTDTGLEQNTLCVNNDIDVESLPYFYLPSISTWAENPYSATMPVFSQMRFAQAPDTMPNMQKFILWRNFQDRQTRHLFEQGLIMPLNYYTTMGGFDPDDDIAEGYQMIVGPMQELKTGYLHTSPRRQVEYGFGAAYANGFQADESYRTSRKGKDISNETLAALFRSRSTTLPIIPAELSEYEPPALPENASPEEVEAYRHSVEQDVLNMLRHRATVGSRVLKVLGLKDISPELRELYPSKDEPLSSFDTTHAQRVASSALGWKTPNQK